jgi:hypothetical protein
VGLNGETLGFGSAESLAAAELVEASADGDGGGGVLVGALLAALLLVGALLAALLLGAVVGAAVVGAALVGAAVVGAALVGAAVVGAAVVGAAVVGPVVPGAADEVAAPLPVAVPLGWRLPDALSPGEVLPVAAPGDVVPEPVPGDVMSGEVVPGEVVPGEVVPGEVVPGELVPGDVLPGGVDGALVDGDVVPVVVPLRDGPVLAVPLIAGPMPGRAGVSAVVPTDGGGEPSGIASPTGVMPVPGTPAGTGGSAAVAGPVATRTAPAYPDSHIVVTSTNSPGCGACTILPSPRYIATWCTVDRSPGLYAQNSRSPGRRSGRSTEVPTLACSREVRGSATPAIQ